MNSILINFAIFIFGAYLGLELGLMDVKKYPPDRTDKPLEKIDYNLPTKMEEAYGHKDKLLRTANGTYLYEPRKISVSHTFSEFVEEQNTPLPTLTELIEQILNDNDMSVEKIINYIEESKYDKGTTATYKKDVLRVSFEQLNMMAMIDLLGRNILVEDNYQLSIYFNDITFSSTFHDKYDIDVIYYAGNGYNRYISGKY